MMVRRTKQSSNSKNINKFEKDKIYKRWLLGATALVVVILFGLLGYGLLDKYWIIPGRSVAEVDGYEISFQTVDQHTRYRRMQMLDQYIAYLDAMKYAGEQRNQVQDILDQIENELDDPVQHMRQVINELINTELVINEALSRNISVDDGEVDSAIRLFLGFVVDQDNDNNEYEEAYRLYFENMSLYTDMDEDSFRKLFRNRLFAEKLQENLGEEEEFGDEEQVSVKHILFSLDNLDQANDVFERVNNGEDFEALAVEFSDDESNAAIGGDLGWVARGEMVNSFEQVVFGEEETGIVPELVATQYGLHIVKIVAKEVRPLAENVVNQRKLMIFNNWLTETKNNSAIEIFDWWESAAPNKPDLQDMYSRIQQSE